MVSPLRVLSLLVLLITVAACSPLEILSTATGLVGGGGGNSGVSVPIDAQIGRENVKQIVATQTTVGGDQSNSKVDVEDANEVTINESPSVWFMILFALGWLLPSPTAIGQWLRSLLTKR